jgi:aryl-alcohol dehydrogenase
MKTSVGRYKRVSTEEEGSMSKNTTQIKAAVVREKGGPFKVETLTLEAPRRDEVLVKVVATGLCHTDMVARDKGYPVPHPIVLGHEGAGIVESVGADVVKVAPGDSVVLTFLTCGRCKPCRLGRMAHCEKTFPLSFGGARLDGSTATVDGDGERVHDHFFGQSSFATYALANERNVVKVGSDVPLELLGPLGCGIQTGAGAVMNALNVRPGTSFASFGAGAVGCSAVMAARAVGATTIVAIDIVPSRLEMAKELGATHAINSKQTDPVEAIEALGSLGTCGIVGAEPLGSEVSFDVNNLMLPGKGIRGILEGESIPDIFIPQLIELNVQGRFPFEKLTKFYSLDQINQAAQDSEQGGTIKPIIRLSPA